jgi:predicted Rossmann fold flavoprotein
LQASSYWQPGSDIVVNLLPTVEVARQLRDAKTTHPKLLLRTLLSELLPRALVLELQELIWSGQAETPIGEIADKTLAGIAETLAAWHLRPAGTEGYRTAEVTLGGIDTDELSSKTMECKRQPRMYCIGEVVDVTGHLGGFNFQWAWSSGQAAGQVA